MPRTATTFLVGSVAIYGLPPHPLTILDGLLQLLGQLENRAETGR